MNKDLLVTLADENYIQQAKQLFSSVYWNAGWKGDYMLLSHEIPEDELLWFSRKGILIKKCELLLNDRWGEKQELPPIIADKFYLFTEEFRQWKHIIYLDADIIVKGPLDKLVNVKYFGAVQDIFFNKLKSQFYKPEKNSYNNKLYNFNLPAFNAGVLSFKTSIIYPALFDELNQLLKKHISGFIFGEQTALNLFFYKRWKKLPLLYNVYANFLHNKLPKFCKYIILHFVQHKDYPPLWDSRHIYYNEWKKNLEKAEKINLSNIPEIRKWSPFKLSFYSMLLKLYIGHKRCLLNLKNAPDKLMGHAGEILNKHYPGLYVKLRKIKGAK